MKARGTERRQIHRYIHIQQIAWVTQETNRPISQNGQYTHKTLIHMYFPSFLFSFFLRQGLAKFPSLGSNFRFPALAPVPRLLVLLMNITITYKSVLDLFGLTGHRCQRNMGDISFNFHPKHKSHGMLHTHGEWELNLKERLLIFSVSI